MTSLAWLVLSITWFVTVAFLVLLLILVLRYCKGLIREIVEAQKPVLLRQLDLVDKATAIAASSDIAGYQGIQVMDQYASGYDEGSFDPSPEAEARREAERMNQDPEDVGVTENAELDSLLLG